MILISFQNCKVLELEGSISGIQSNLALRMGIYLKTSSRKSYLPEAGPPPLWITGSTILSNSS